MFFNLYHFNQNEGVNSGEGTKNKVVDYQNSGVIEENFNQHHAENGGLLPQGISLFSRNRIKKL